MTFLAASDTGKTKENFRTQLKNKSHIKAKKQVSTFQRSDGNELRALANLLENTLKIR